MNTQATEESLLVDISHLIETARNHVSRLASSTLVMLYWEIGRRINQEILKNQRAGYGEQVIDTLSNQSIDQPIWLWF